MMCHSTRITDLGAVRVLVLLLVLVLEPLASTSAMGAPTMRNREPLVLAEHAAIVQADFDHQQHRLEALAPLRHAADPWTIYHLAKAQAWLEYAFDARAMRDRSGVIEEALENSRALTTKLEAGDQDISLETPIGAQSMRLRDDLWLIAAEMKRLHGLGCAATEIAQFEVQLVRAGHAYRMLGWRHSRPYLQAAERLSHDAQAQVLSCSKTSDSVAAPPLSAVPVSAPPVSTPPVAVSISPDSSAPITLPAQVHFAFDRSNLGAATKAVLDEVAAVLHEHPAVNVGLEGHADRRGTLRHNLALSLRRAQAVENYLEHAGIAPERLKVVALGTHQPVSAGPTELDYARNRRVEFVPSSGTKRLARTQQSDLQILRPARRRSNSHKYANKNSRHDASIRRTSTRRPWQSSE